LKNTKMLVLVIMIISAVAAVYSFWDIIMSFLVPAILAYLLNPLTKRVIKYTGLKRGYAVALVALMVVGIITFIGSLVLPPLVEQLGDLVEDLQYYASNFDEIVDEVTAFMASLRLPQEVLDSVAEVVSQGDSYIVSFVGSLLTSLLGMSLQIFDIVIAIIVLVYFMLDGPKLVRSLINFFPKEMSGKIDNIIKESDFIAKKYIRSRFIISGCMAIAIFCGLRFIFGIEYAPVFALLSFCLDFIPYFGSLIGSIIQIFYSLITGGFSFALGVAVYVITVQQIEGNILAPKIEGNATGIHPLTVLFALLAAEEVFGPLGMLISTPVAAIIKMIVLELYSFVVSKDEPENNIPLPEGEQNG